MYMSDTLIIPNSIWPNGMKVDSDGHAVFYPLGTNKVEVPTSASEWPKGNRFISPYVFQDDKLVGFVDTKALILSDNTTIYLPYSHIDAEFSAINKGQLQIHAPKAITKKASWKDSGKEDIPEVQFKYKGCTTIDNVTSVDANYQTTDIVDGVWSEPLWDLEQGGNGESNGSMFYKCSQLSLFTAALSSMTDANSMFYYCDNLTSFTADLSSLANGEWMFYYCKKFTSFTADLPSLTNGEYMFCSCTNLESFSSDSSGSPVNLSSLTNGESMF